MRVAAKSDSEALRLLEASDCSAEGSVWTYFPHEHARSRAYRWREDGLANIYDGREYVRFALALCNGRDPILKERVLRLSCPERNHGEDVKECYIYLDSTPTHSYMKCLDKYPQREFPYAWLLSELYAVVGLREAPGSGNRFHRPGAHMSAIRSGSRIPCARIASAADAASARPASPAVSAPRRERETDA